MESLTYHPYTEWKFTAEGYRIFGKHIPTHHIHKGELLITTSTANVDANILCALSADSLCKSSNMHNRCIIYIINKNGPKVAYYTMNTIGVNAIPYLIPTECNKICALENELKAQKKALSECQALCEDLKALISSFKELENEISK